MKMSRSFFKLTLLATLTLACAQASYATSFTTVTTDLQNNSGLMCCPHWYVGGNIGGSYVHDKPFPGTPDYVAENGVGWNVNTGYQFFHIYSAMFGGELGYSQYADSREYLSPSTTVGRTEHYSAYLAATGQVPLIYNFSALGKLGVAYGYARKNAYPTNFSASANSYGLYYGGGLMYNVTKAAALVAQWNRDRGNGSTGSTDLYTIGVQVNLA